MPCKLHVGQEPARRSKQTPPLFNAGRREAEHDCGALLEAHRRRGAGPDARLQAAPGRQAWRTRVRVGERAQWGARIKREAGAPNCSTICGPEIVDSSPSPQHARSHWSGGNTSRRGTRTMEAGCDTSDPHVTRLTNQRQGWWRVSSPRLEELARQPHRVVTPPSRRRLRSCMPAAPVVQPR